MYNRYIPQSDGSFQKNKVQDPRQQIPRPKPEANFQNAARSSAQSAPAQSVPASCSDIGAATFLKQLLPKDFDTGDLLIVLLLLLMAGDCEKEKNNALLTLALYLFM